MAYLRFEGDTLIYGYADKEPENKNLKIDFMLAIKPPHPEYPNKLNIKSNNEISKAEFNKDGENINIDMVSGDKFTLVLWNQPKLCWLEKRKV